MSMNYYASTEYGMVFSYEDLENIKKWFVERGELADDADYWETVEATSYGIESFGEFTGETYKIDEYGAFSIPDQSYHDEAVFYMPFSFMYHGMYEKVAEDYRDFQRKCMQEFYEFKESLEWLEALNITSREDLMSRIRQINGVYYG